WTVSWSISRSVGSTGCVISRYTVCEWNELSPPASGRPGCVYHPGPAAVLGGAPLNPLWRRLSARPSGFCAACRLSSGAALHVKTLQTGWRSRMFATPPPSSSAGRRLQDPPAGSRTQNSPEHRTVQNSPEQSRRGCGTVQASHEEPDPRVLLSLSGLKENVLITVK
uniref:Uncharacterized protein n=1 Tax=Salarias fasciatus TaxID=181472 RepID=A0A672ICV1_SALFA